MDVLTESGTAHVVGLGGPLHQLSFFESLVSFLYGQIGNLRFGYCAADVDALLAVNDRAHFLAYTARAMRSIIVDFARGRLRERRGGDAEHVTLNTDLEQGLPVGDEQIVLVHDALQALAQREPRLAQVVEMRYFGGLDEQEIAAALEVTDRTVRRDWEKARLLLADALSG